MAQSPRVLLVGSGGVGGVVGALLSRAGCDLTIVTGNPEISAAISDRGLRVRELDGREWSARPPRPPVSQLRDLQGAPPYDLALLATKTTSLESVLPALPPLLGPDGGVVCMQTGLPEERAAAALGQERVVGCVVSWGATLLAPGYSARTSRGGFQLGRLQPGGATDTGLARAAAVLGQALPTRVIDNLAGVRWCKLAVNCATSTLGAAGGDTLGRLLRQRVVRRLTLEIWSELCAVAQAAGVELAPVMGNIDIRSLALTATERRRRLGSPGLVVKHALLWALGLRYRRMRSSMAVAIERGRTPEIDYLNGEIVRRGAALGVATPLNAALVSLIHDIVAKRQQPGLDTLHAVAAQHQRALLTANAPRLAAH
jgi:2-dehydropantoate 2-reductase